MTPAEAFMEHPILFGVLGLLVVLVVLASLLVGINLALEA